MNPAVLTFISAVAASVVAALLVAAILYIGRWLPTSIYPDLRGTWLITIREGDFVLDEQAKIKYQLRWWFSGKVHDSQGRPTRISGRCFGSQIVTYTHAHPNPSKMMAVGSGVVVVDVLRRSAKGYAVFVGPKAEQTQAPGDPSVAQVEMKRPPD